MELFVEFSNWLDKHLSKRLPIEVIAINFNLYDGYDDSDNTYTYDIQLIGCDRFDEEDDDWACYDIFTTGEDVFSIPEEHVPHNDNIPFWDLELPFLCELAKRYLNEGKYADKLKNYTAVAIGHVSGELVILHRKQ